LTNPAQSESQPQHRAFAALRAPGFGIYLVGSMLAMMADAIEHVISYWIVFEKFRSPALGGFAVFSHWLPFLLFSVWSGVLADRFDPRRIIQIGMVLYMLCSLAWGLLFLTDSLEVWHAIAILSVHGIAGVLWAQMHGRNTSDRYFAVAQSAMNIIAHLTAFLLFSVIYGLKVRALYSATAVAIVTALLLLELMSRDAAWHEVLHLPVEGHRSTIVLLALVGGLIAGELTWGLNYWAALSTLVGGAFLLVGVPWFALIAGGTLHDVGRFTLFTPGDDFSLFQRFTYRIFMQGYWLEGGQWTFWYQPLYRWIIGLVHIVFGDSSVGEWYLDATSLMVGGLFAFVVCSRAASFAWGMAALVLVLATVAIGPSWWVVGRDLSEITAAGFAYTAALLILASGRTNGDAPGERSAWPILVAGVLAVLCFYTRLNHLLWQGALVALLLPLTMPAAALWRPRIWMSWSLVKHAAIIALSLGTGVVLFAWRTWYYTGVFSVLFGTQRDLVATVQPGDTWQMAVVHMIQSVLVQVTVQDPPQFDPRALVVIAGIVVSMLALARVPVCRDVPAGPALFCCASLIGALIARGTAYVGRFSIHLMPVAVAVAVCFAAHVFRRVRPAPVASTP
jgi:MFS family permease